MEIYGLILAKNIRKYNLLKCFISIILDTDLIFAVFKAE